jgi:hypothetical protein
MFRYLVLLLIFAGCQSGHDFVINGHLPDVKTDGEWVFLVPLENASKERVDSVKIANGAFKFEELAGVPEIYIIRTKPILRLTYQELLVVKEPGELTVVIGDNSIASGTVLNDSLQKWKEKKEVFDYSHEVLRQKFKKADVAEQEVIKQKSDSLNGLIINFHYNFVRNNRNNVVGKFVKKMMGNSFTAEQKKELSIQ